MDDYRKTIDRDTFERSFLGQLEAARLTGEKLVEEHRLRCAEVLLSAGITLIPSDDLLDHQFVVSRGVYNAAQKIGKGREI